MALSSELLGVEPKALGETTEKDAFARALVEHCETHDELSVLAEAIRLSANDGDPPSDILPAADDELPEGTDVGAFRIVARLAREHLASIYRAVPKSAERAPETVHVKVFRKECTRDRIAAWRLLTAARALSELRDPGLVGIVEAGTLRDGRVFLVTEAAQGERLSRRVARSGPLGPSELKPIVRTLVSGLARLHDRGFLHGYLNPDDVLIARPSAESDGRAQPLGMLDGLGVARLLEGSDEALRGVLRVIGDPATVAPEIARGQGATVESEVYALGCLLYYALTGAPVFDGETPADQMLAHLLEEPTPPSVRAPQANLGSEVDAVITRALAKHPRDRYPNVRALGDAFSAIASAAAHSPSAALELTRLIESLRAAPEDQALAGELEAICAEADDYRLALDAFVDAADLSDAVAVKKQLWFRSARIALDELDDHTRGIALLERARACDPDDDEAHGALEALYRASGDHEALIGLLLDRLESETQPEARGAVLRDVAQLYEEKLDLPDNALVAYTQAITEQPSDGRARRAIERLASAKEKLQEVLASLHESLSTGDLGAEERVKLSVLVANWSANGLGRLDAALPYLQDALRIDPTHEPAREALSALYRKAEAWSELTQQLVSWAASSSDAAKKTALEAEAAEIAHTRLRDIALAERLYESVLAADPAHVGALTTLETLYAQAGAREKLLGLLAQKLEVVVGSERAETLCTLATLQDDDEASDLARELYERALLADVRHVPAYRGLEELCMTREDLVGLSQVLSRQLAIATTPQQRIALLERLATTAEDLLGDPVAAAEHYAQIVELVPSHEHANVALARLYRQLHRFEQLAETYERHAKSEEDTARKTELLMSAARVMIADIGSPERAASYCARVLALAPSHCEALVLSTRLRAHGGDALAAVDALALLADAESDPARVAELRVRAAELLEAEGDLDRAIVQYLSALEASPSLPAAVAALSRLYRQRGDIRGEADLLAREAELTSDPERRADMFVTLGALRHQRLNERALAHEAYRRAYESAPLSKDALLGLGMLALEDERWDEAIACLEPLLDHTSGLPDEVATSLFRGAGDAFRALGFLAKAERCYASARALAPHDRILLERLAEVAIAGGRPDEAASLLAHLLDEAGPHAAGLSFAEQQALRMQLGEALRAQGEHARAAVAFGDVLVANPDALEALEALATVQEAEGDLAALVRTVERQLARAPSAEARFSLLLRAGDLHAQLGHQKQASDLYVKALELKADDRNLLSKLMAVYSAGKNWTRLVDVLVRMAQVVDDPALRAKYMMTAAGVAQTELGELDAAVRMYEQALALDPRLDAAFRGITACLSRAGAWDRLAHAHRAHIDRCRDRLDPDALFTLWRELGAMQHERLHRLEPAVEAYEQANALKPDDDTVLARLVELYSLSPSRFADNAIAVHDRLLAQNPYRVESYRALRKLYTQLSRADEAWCVCQALRSLSMAEPEEEAFFKRHRVQAPATARACITEELWHEHLLPREQDDAVTRLFALVQPAAVRALGQSPEAFGIAGGLPIDCERDEAVMARMLHYAAGVMLVPLPTVYMRPRDGGGVSILFTDPPSLGLGRGALRDAPDQALAFMAGRQLSYFRPGHYMRLLVPTGSGLRSWLLAAVRLAQPRFPVPDALAAQVERCQLALSNNLHTPQQQALTSMIEQLLREKPELDMKRWALTVDLAADRAGFVLANSLDAAVAMVRASPPDSSLAGERERLKALYQYAVSPAYLALRKAIGVTIS